MNLWIFEGVFYRSWFRFLDWNSNFASQELVQLKMDVLPKMCVCVCFFCFPLWGNVKQFIIPSLKRTYPSYHLKMDAWKMTCPFGARPIFRAFAVRFREGIRFATDTLLKIQRISNRFGSYLMDPVPVKMGFPMSFYPGGNSCRVNAPENTR